MLCFRCEHRARFLETGRKPRHECGQINESNIGCYMFKPCKPVIMERPKNDPRPAHGGYLGARMMANELADNCELALSSNGWLYWKEINTKGKNE